MDHVGSNSVLVWERGTSLHRAGCRESNTCVRQVRQCIISSAGEFKL